MAGGVFDYVDDVVAVFFLLENLSGDFDEEGFEIAGVVEIGVEAGELLVVELADFFKELVTFGEDLHDAVFDSVVNGFDEMAGAACADVRDAGFSGEILGGDGLENVFEVVP